MAFYIGLMSGTSMDGVDAALVNVNTHQCILGITRPYGESAQQFLASVLQSQSIGLGTLSQLNTVLGREFGQAAMALLQQAHCSAKDIVAIGSHGQTIAHDATAKIPYTVQLACPHTIAEMTGIRVVADFRTRDLVVGGQGAPFAPLYHQALFSEREWPLVAVNLGGIANVTFLDKASPPRGFDTGPGNCLMDLWIREIHHQPFDADGAWASTGKVIQPLLDACLSDSFFKTSPPKSMGKEYFSRAWLQSKLQPDYPSEDIQATLLMLTAVTVGQAIAQYKTYQPSYMVLCGGGVHNKALQRAIQQQVTDIPVISSAQWGIDPDFIEAMMFAWLADKTIRNVPMDLTALTGARKPVILGAVYA